jgi:hypothetical protein
LSESVISVTCRALAPATRVRPTGALRADQLIGACTSAWSPSVADPVIPSRIA